MREPRSLIFTGIWINLLAVGAATIKTVQVSATIENIDKATREVTLKGPHGKTKTVMAGDEVKNFDQLKEGDHVVATVTQALAIGFMKPSQ